MTCEPTGHDHHINPTHASHHHARSLELWLVLIGDSNRLTATEAQMHGVAEIIRLQDGSQPSALYVSDHWRAKKSAALLSIALGIEARECAWLAPSSSPGEAYEWSVVKDFFGTLISPCVLLTHATVFMDILRRSGYFDQPRPDFPPDHMLLPGETVYHTIALE